MKKQYALVTVSPEGKIEIIVGAKVYCGNLDGHNVIIKSSQLVLHSITSADLDPSKKPNKRNNWH